MTNPINPNRTFSTKLRRPRRDVNKTNALTAGAPNPFGSSVQFTEVAYLDQLNQQFPPTVPVFNFFPSASDVATNGITIELWFMAESSGSLVSVVMNAVGQATTAIAPLIYIDSNGLLRGGLFDSTQITLLSPLQNLIASQGADGLINTGALNVLKSPLSVIDGEWHHAALVVQPGNAGTQSLYLDGRLAATGTANGSFGFSFVASDASTWTPETNVAIRFGGPITPQPQSPPEPNFLPYAQGFSGCLNELRTWDRPRSITQIQQLIAQPLGSDLSTYQQQGLVGYAGSSQLQAAVQPGAYLSMTSDAPPFDPFTEVTNRIPGYQNFGICTAIPFTTVALEVTFQPAETYSTKISLRQGDQLQVSFPSTDANDDNLAPGTVFSMLLSGGASGEINNLNQIAPGSVFTIGVAVTDCYRLDFTCSPACTIDNLQFMLIPGPTNTLMQLLLDVTPMQAAYSDPNYPLTQTIVPDPRHQGQNVTLNPYWPLFTDETVFPIDPTKYSANDLLSAYLNFNDAARKVSLQSGATFSDFLTLYANDATIDQVSDLSTLLQEAYSKVTGNQAPAILPTAPFNTSVDQVYAFIYNVNAMRRTLSEFLTVYQGWAQVIIDDLALNNIPAGVANQIYNAQEKLTVPLKGPSTGEFIANLLLGSALVGLGAVLPMALPAVATALGAAAVTNGAMAAATFAASAGANVLSEICGAFLGSTTVQPKLSKVSYSTLEDVVVNVAADTSAAYSTILGNFLDPEYLQTLYSNYGLLQALSYVNAQPLYTANQSAIQPGANNSLIIGTTYASWKALIPSVFTWTPQLLTNQSLHNNNVFMVTQGSPLSLPFESVPSSLGIFEVLKNDPWKAFYWMLHQVQQWQLESQSGQLFSVCPIFYYGSPPQRVPFETTADWVIAWSLIDTNQNAMSDVLATTLFGAGNSNTPLSLIDQNNPLAAAGYGWYCPIANAAVTTPFDAFMNWGEGVPSYSPQILVAQYPEDGHLYPASLQGDNIYPVTFAAVAAADVPPPALVTLEPSVLSFGGVAIGSSSQLTAVLTNNQQNSLQNITAAGGWPTAFMLENVPPEIQPGDSATITVSFLPNATEAAEQSGKATFSSQGQYGPISLTLEFSGTGVEPV